MHHLVTGGTGFLGAYLLYYLLGEGKSVKALKRANSDLTHLNLVFEWLGEKDELSSGEINHRIEAIEWVEADLLDTERLIAALSEVESIYHSAAKVSFDPGERESVITTNVDGTANLVNLALETGVPYFYHISSVSSLNRQANQWVDEQMGQFPKSFPTIYAESKFRSEREVWRGFAEGLQGLIINPSVILGPGHWDRGAGHLFKRIWKGMAFYPPGGNAYVDARDVVETLLKLRDTPAAYENRFVLVSESLPMKDAMTWIADGLGVKPPRYKANQTMAVSVAYLEKLKSWLTGGSPVLTPDLARMAMNTFYYDTSKLNQYIEHTFRPVKESIQETCDFILEQNLTEDF